MVKSSIYQVFWSVFVWERGWGEGGKAEKEWEANVNIVYSVKKKPEVELLLIGTGSFLMQFPIISKDKIHVFVFLFKDI